MENSENDPPRPQTDRERRTIRRVESTLYPRHLDSPLSDCQLRFWASHEERFKRRYRHLDHKGLRPFIHGSIGGVPVLSELENRVRCGILPTTDGFRGWYSEMLQVVEQSVRVQINAAFQHVGELNERNLSGIMEKLRNSEEASTALYYKVLVERFHHEVLMEYRVGNIYLKTSILPDFGIEKDLVQFTWVDGLPLIVTYDMLLCVLDKLESKFTFEALLEVMDGIPFYHRIGFKPFQREIYELLDSAYRENGSLAAHLFKSLEPLACGTVLKLEPARSCSHNFRVEIERALVEKCPDLRAPLSILTNLYDSMIEEHGEDAVTTILESYGQEKLHFFPFVDEEGGHIKMYRYGTSFRSISHDFVLDLMGATIRQFMKVYYTRENTLPPVRLNQATNPRIRKMVETDTLPSNKILLSIPDRDWNMVTFKKVFEFNHRPDPFDHIQDKAISPDMRNVSQIWNPQVRDAYGIPEPEEIQTTRYAEWILSQRKIDTKRYYDEWDAHGGILPHQRLIQCRAKERENKIDSRDYSILHPEVRTALSTTEYNLSKSVFPFYPQQTMTATGAELTRITDDLAAPHLTRGLIKITFHLDISQWNYCFRSRMTSRFQEFFNQIFGVTYFTHVMSVFQSSVILSGNSFDPPLVGGRFCSWRNHIGGNQGILQKLWTFITMNLIIKRMETYGSRYVLIGSGDNQVLSVWMADDETLPAECIRVKTLIEEDFSQVGLEVKIEETWHSAYLLVYRRQYHFRGEPVSLVIKPVCRFAAGISDGYSSISIHAMTSMGAGQQLSNSSHHPVVGPILGLVEFLIGIMANPIWKRNARYNEDQWVALTLIGSGLGLLPIMQLPGLSYSGHKDYVSENLAMLRRVYEIYPHLRIPLIQLLKFRIPNPSPSDSLSLVLDPMGPNIWKPPTAESFLKRTVTEGLRNKYHIENERVREMFTLLDPDESNQLADGLLEMRPLNLSVCRALFEYSELGTVLSVSNRFNKMKSIVKVITRSMMDTSTPSLLAVVEARDQRMLSEILSRFRHLPSIGGDFFEDYLGHYYDNYLEWCSSTFSTVACTFSLRLFLIAFTYRLGDIVPEGPYSPAPLEQLQLTPGIENVEHGDSLIILPSKPMLKTTEELDRKRGCYKKYIGSTTREPIRTMSLVSLSGSDNAKSINMYTKLFVWAKLSGDDSNTKDFISAELDCRVAGLSDVLKKLDFGASGGCIRHRLAVPGEPMGAYLSSLSNISTHYKISSDRASMFQRGQTDYNIFYQEAYQFIMACLRYSQPVELSFKARIRMECCTQMIVPEPITLPRPLSYSRVNYTALSTTMPLDLEHMRGLIESANLVRKHNLDEIKDPRVALASYIAHQVGGLSRTYITGVDQSRASTRWESSTSGSVNLSILRNVPMDILIKSTAHSLVLSNSFGPWTNMGKIKKRLKVLSYGPTGNTDFGEYKVILEAIVTVGKLPDLCYLAGTPPRWMTRDADKGILNIFLRACYNVLFEPEHRKVPYGILVEYKSNCIVFEKVLKHLRNWNRRVRAHLRAADTEIFLSYLERVKGRIGPTSVFVTHSRSDFLEKARSKIAPEPDDTQATRQKPLRLLSDPGLKSPEPWSTYRVRKKGMPTGRKSAPMFGAIPSDSQIEIPFRGFQILRFATNSSGARVKFLDIVFRHMAGLQSSAGLGVFLAEGPASMMSAALHYAPNLTCYYNSLVTPNLVPAGQATGFVPPEIMCSCDIAGRVVNLPYLPVCFGDLADDHTWAEISSSTRDHSIDLLVVDLPSNVESRGKIMLSLASYCTSHRPARAIIKLATSELLAPWALQLVRSLIALGSIHFEKLFSSNYWSSEIYLVMIAEPNSLTPNDLEVQMELACRQLSRREPQPWGKWLDRVEGSLAFFRRLSPCSWINPVTNNTFSGTERISRELGDVLLQTIKMILEENESGRKHPRPGLQLMIKSDSSGHRQFLANLSGLLDVQRVMYMRCLTTVSPGESTSEFDIRLVLSEIRKIEGTIIEEPNIQRSDILWRRLGYLMANRPVQMPMEELALSLEFVDMLPLLPEQWKKSYESLTLPRYFVESFRQLRMEGLRGCKSPFELAGFRSVLASLPKFLRRQKIGTLRRITTDPEWIEPLCQSILGAVYDPINGVVDFVLLPVEMVDLGVQLERPTMVMMSTNSIVRLNAMEQNIPGQSDWYRRFQGGRGTEGIFGIYGINL